MRFALATQSESAQRNNAARLVFSMHDQTHAGRDATATERNAEMQMRRQIIRICALLFAVLTVTAMAGCSNSPRTEQGGSGTEGRQTRDSGSGGGY